MKADSLKPKSQTRIPTPQKAAPQNSSNFKQVKIFWFWMFICTMSTAVVRLTL